MKLFSCMFFCHFVIRAWASIKSITCVVASRIWFGLTMGIQHVCWMRKLLLPGFICVFINVYCVFPACKEAYSDQEGHGACSLGCNAQLPFAQRRQQQVCHEAIQHVQIYKCVGDRVLFLPKKFYCRLFLACVIQILMLVRHAHELYCIIIHTSVRTV